MLYDDVETPDETSPDDLLSTYADDLAAAVDEVGRDDIVAAGVDGDAVDAVAAGDVAAVTVTDAAAILGRHPDNPPADVIEAEVRDHLLLGMTSAVLDVDALASRVDAALSPREIQQKVEGRAAMTLGEYVQLQHVVAAGKR